MRIGVDATCWANERGYGRFTRELLTAMVELGSPHRFVCFLDDRSAARFTLSGDAVEPVIVRQGVSPTLAAASGGGRSPIDMLRLTRAVHRARVDVFLSPSVYGFFPLPPGLPAVVTIHDAIPERFPALTLPTRRDRWFWRIKMLVALKQARLVLSVSDHAANEVAQYLRVPRSRIRVTLEGVAAEYRPSETRAAIDAAARRAGVPEGARWLMYVGGFGPHKHIDLIVRAHAAVARRHADRPLLLLLVGPRQDAFHQDMAAIHRAIEAGGSRDLVRWPGYLADEELRHLHSGAVALVLASADEGFGLPAVEAARCGTPVVATVSSPLPQILDGGGLFVDPGDAGAIERAIEALVTDEPARQAMGRRALERAQALSWPRSAGVALAALEEAASARSRRAPAPRSEGQPHADVHI
jgi:glycosyltransferase involved in cell wall biosynthesis